MIILTNGDSWTQGDHPAQDINWEAEKNIEWYDVPIDFGNKEYTPDPKLSKKFYDSEVWPKVLGRQLYNLNSKIKVVNGGRLGSSNSSICRRTVNLFKDIRTNTDEPIFAIIGWSSKYRNDIFTRQTQADGTPVFYRDQLRPSKWKQDYVHDLTERSFTEDFILNVLFLQNFFYINSIDYLFFNCFDYIREEAYLESFIDKSKWVDNTYNVAHFEKYILKQTNCDWSSENEYFITGHPRDNAHTLWGNFLTDYIKKNYEFYKVNYI